MGRKSKRKRIYQDSISEQKPKIQSSNLGRFLIEIIRWGAYIALFAPLIVHSGFFFPFVVPKAIFFWIFSEIIFAAWLVLAISNKQFRPRFDALSIAFGFFLLVTILTSFTGINIERSFWSTLERMAGTVNWIHLALFFLALVSTFRTVFEWKKLLTVSLIVSTLVALIFLFQKIGISILPFDARGGSTIGNSSFMAAYLLFNVFFGIWLFVRQKIPYMKFFYGAGVALLVLAVIFSTAYGALVSMFGGFFIILIAWLFFARKIPFARGIAIVLISLFILLSGIVAWGTLTQNEKVINKLPYFFSDSGTIGARKVVWRMAWQGVKERPALGWGPENFNAAFTKYFNPCLTLYKCGHEIWFDRTHNVILDNLIHSGFVGLFAYLSIFAAGVWMALKTRGNKGRQEEGSSGDWLLGGIFLAALASYFVQNLFVFDMPSTYIMFALTLAFGSAVLQGKDEEKKDERPLRVHWTAAALVAIFLAYSLFSFGIQSFQAAYWGIKISRGGMGAQETIDLYKKTLSITSLGNRQIVEFFTTKITDAIKQDKEQKIPASFVFEVEKIMRKISSENPYDFRHKIILGDLYLSARKYNPEFAKLAEQTFKEAIEMAPTNQQGYDLLGQLYLFLGEYEKSIENFKKAIDLEPRFVLPHVLLAKAYKAAGDKKLADEELQKAAELGYEAEK